MFLQTLLQATEKAALHMKLHFEKPFAVHNKEGVNNLVTEVDTACEAIILNTIQSAFPQHAILTEEAGSLVQDSAYKWIIDPIDGTVNFAHGIPICCVSIGLEHNGSMVLGAVYNPFLNEFFVAEKGKGATLNQKPIQVSQKQLLLESCLVTGFPYTYLDMPNGPLQVFEKLIKKGIPVRRLGSAAIDLCYVAAGRFDGFYEHKLQAWDSAAGFLMVTEAGGTVTDFEGKPYSVYQPHLLATNGIIHTHLQAVINGAEV
ncbi:MAG: inositol monophosphatase [Bacteroidetes bacterium]|nr:MAG: inositol monophosphatase [Bacteroidota bacterium]TAE63736.1 MAG: inositol monophosphatase [Bacteroidota bacterium]TAF89189.1 MAG: inositol monophosphatase [Bacteroidota bacterium]